MDTITVWFLHSSPRKRLDEGELGKRNLMPNTDLVDKEGMMTEDYPKINPKTTSMRRITFSIACKERHLKGIYDEDSNSI